MFKYLAIRKYGNKLLPKLQQRYGRFKNYRANQIRATVYQCDFDPDYLPLAYMMFLNEEELDNVITTEFPDLSVPEYKKEMNEYLGDQKFQAFFTVHSA